MATPFIGEISAFGFNFAPRGWALCNGQILSIAQHSALFSILGTTYGGNGQTTFALPNLQGRIPMHWGNSTTAGDTVLGEVQGTEAVTLLVSNLPSHNHTINAGNEPSGYDPELQSASPSTTAYLSQSSGGSVWEVPGTVNEMLSPMAIGVAGQSHSHDNMQPYLAISFCIALEGVFPSRN